MSALLRPSMGTSIRTPMRTLLCALLLASALPAWAVAGCAAASSTLAVMLTHPADVVKTRLQVTERQTLLKGQGSKS